MGLILSFIHKYLLSKYYVADAILGSWDQGINGTYRDA